MAFCLSSSLKPLEFWNKASVLFQQTLSFYGSQFYYSNLRTPEFSEQPAYNTTCLCVNTINRTLQQFQQRAVTTHCLVTNTPLSNCFSILIINKSVSAWVTSMVSSADSLPCRKKLLQIIYKCAVLLHYLVTYLPFSTLTSKSTLFSCCTCCVFQGQFRWIDCPLLWHCLNIPSIQDITINKGINDGVVSSLLAHRLPFGSKNSGDSGQRGKTNREEAWEAASDEVLQEQTCVLENVLASSRAEHHFI